MTSPLVLTCEEKRIVAAILADHVPEREVWAFGSRARGQAKPWSDLDLAILGNIPLPLAVRAALEDAFSASLLPWKVDVLDWATTDDAYRQIIRREHVVVKTAPFSP